jgi:hypothetical protein
MWPTDKNECATCKSDKLKKFTIENEMIPLLDHLDPQIQKDLEDLTQIEEMLISPVAPMMSIYRLSGGQLVNNGYSATFSQDLKPILKDLPRLPNEVEIIVIQKKNKQNINKQFLCSKNRVERVVRFLSENNPFWIKNGIKLNYQNLNFLPEYGIPQDLPILYEDDVEEQNSNNNDLGPEINENIDLDQSLEDEHCYIEIDPDDLQQINKVKAKINIPIIDKNPLNEFETSGILTLAFPKLFPLGLADPTNKIRQEFVTETEGYKHLIKYCCKDSKNNLYYPFAQHPRFLFYVSDRLRRHRTLTQSKVYLQQNSCDATLSIGELKQIISDNNRIFFNLYEF